MVSVARAMTDMGASYTFGDVDANPVDERWLKEPKLWTAG